MKLEINFRVGMRLGNMLLLGVVLSVLALAGMSSIKAEAGEIFTRESVKMSYPAQRQLALKTPMLTVEGIKYASSDNCVVRIDSDGVVLALGPGVCTVTATTPDGVTDVCTVTVEEPDAPHKQIALTFDDGPDYYGQELLDFLADRGVKVTFFYIGNQINKYKDNVYRAYNEGHEIGNHSFTHPSLATKNIDKIRYELDSCTEAIYNAIGTFPTVFRPPYGAKSDTLLENCHYPVILWSVDTLDWKYRDADRVANEICKGATDGAVILVHEIHKTTIQGAKTAIDKLLADGWEFVTMTELLERDGAVLEDGVIYSKKK